MEELLGKIDQLENKLSTLLDRYNEKARNAAHSTQEMDRLKGRIEQLEEENRRLQSMVDQVRDRVSNLLDRVDDLSEEPSDHAPGLFS